MSSLLKRKVAGVSGSWVWWLSLCCLEDDISDLRKNSHTY